MRDIALPAIKRHGAIRASIIDGSGFPKKRGHSVVVARQYYCLLCGCAVHLGSVGLKWIFA